MKVYNNLINKKFNSLTIIGQPQLKKEKDGKSRTHILCKCDCGKEKEIRLTMVVHNEIKSCGCLCYEKDINGYSLIKRKKLNTSGGYIKIYEPSHPHANKRGHVFEHRLIMEKYIKRYLTKDETIHHKNCNKSDNRIENLELWASNHQKGARIEDLIFYAKEILSKYSDYKNPTILAENQYWEDFISG